MAFTLSDPFVGVPVSAPKPGWTAGTCSHRGCTMTLVMYIGGGQWLCWLHAVVLGVKVPR